MNFSDIKFYTKTHNGDTRTFFTLNDRYSGYVSRDGQTYFVLDSNTNSYTDYSRAQLEQFIKNFDSGNVYDITNVNPVKSVNDFVSNVTASDTGKITTGVILLGTLILGTIILTKK